MKQSRASKFSNFRRQHPGNATMCLAEDERTTAAAGNWFRVTQQAELLSQGHVL